MIYWASGSGFGEPEHRLRDRCNVMISYARAISDGIRTIRRVRAIRRARSGKGGTLVQRKSGEVEIGIVESHFLDSGAFTLLTRSAEYARENKCSKWLFYDTDEFWSYMDQYAAFVKKYKIAIDLYANVDAIPNPDLTWRNQKYLEEKHGLSPVPVVHYRTDLKWLRRYMDNGYDIIGLGGLVGNTAKDHCREWLDRAFDMVCDQPSRLPRVKLHGFGVTSYDLLLRYPWWSVDSVTWAKIGAFGGILLPHKRKGKFIFNESSYVIKIDHTSPDRKIPGKHYFTLTKTERLIVREWLEIISVPLGKTDDKGEVTEPGVTNNHAYRRAACLLFFEEMRKSLPEWPWPFHYERERGFF